MTFKTGRRIARDKKGQVTVMIAMMLMTFIMFFMFVINTGMLVNAKINLQNAADMAAYAGASVQARTLDQISYLNYEARRQYKKFLFRYYIIGNMAQDSFSEQTAARFWGPNRNVNFQVPATCVIFNRTDDYCRMPSLQPITIPNENPFDQVNNTLRQQLIAIEQVRQRSCETIGQTNLQLLLLWLWNTDPNVTGIVSAFSQSNRDMGERIKGMTLGLGLIPREALIQKRIETLQYYVNSEGLKNVGIEKVQGLMSGTDPARRERTIQAFLSAFHTLGNHSFKNTEKILMDELLPIGTEGASLLALKPLYLNGASVYAVEFRAPAGAQEALTGANARGSECSPFLHKVPIPQLFLGVSKAPNILTYYAVRLQAEPQLLFNPFGALQLKAYSAAQPFGSRIGPYIDKPNNAFAEDASSLNITVLNDGPPSLIPNLPIKASDSLSITSGWNRQEVMLGLFNSIFPPGGHSMVSAEALETVGYAKAMAPNPVEIGDYNIINDANEDPFIRHFDESGKYSFWAPIHPPDKMGGGKAQQELLDALVKQLDESGNQDVATNSSGQQAKLPEELKEAFKTALSGYFEKLRSGQGEDGESWNLVRLSDPLNIRTPDGKKTPITVPGYWTNDAATVKTSWNAVKDGELRKFGRTGYSVKFVSFSALMKKEGLSTNGKGGAAGGSTWENVFDTDGDMQEELNLIQH